MYRALRLLSLASGLLVLALAHDAPPPPSPIDWSDTPLARVEALTLIETLNAEILSANSATLTLERLCLQLIGNEPAGWDGLHALSEAAPRADRLQLSAALFEHRAVLYTPEHRALAEVHEVYQRDILAFPEPQLSESNERVRATR